MDSSISWNIFERPYEIVGHPDMSGVYEHFKSVSDNVRLYYVHCAVRNIETDDCIVIYEPLYIPEGRVYGRPLKEFTEIVNVEEGQAPRFRYINL